MELPLTNLADDLRAHHPDAMPGLIDSFGREVHAVAYLIVRDHEDAEEVAMDTFVAAWRSAKTLKSSDALRPWLLRIATRQALSRRRRKRAVVETRQSPIDESRREARRRRSGRPADERRSGGRRGR
jgi:RNA polymerase sigma factor (sigma-70 family)